MRSLLPLLACAVFVLAAVPSRAGAGPTFSKDVAPILYAKCATCHRPGQVGPFSLLTYDDARKRAAQLARVTGDRTMPPWMPHPEWGQFARARVLGDAERGVFGKWAEAGAPEGDARDLPPMPKFKEGWQLGEPDVVLKMSQPFTIPAEGRDVYVHFVFPLKFDRDRYLSGIEVRPGNRRVAHHAAGLLDTSGKARARAKAAAARGEGDGTSYGGNDPGFMPAGFTPGFVPGQEPARFPPGEAITIRKNADFVLQMHYHPVGRVETDQTVIGLHFTDVKPKRGPAIMLMGALDIDIPPGERSYRKRDAYRIPVDFEMRNVWAHMHLVGKQAKLWAELPDGRGTRRLLWIDDWNFNWQDTYAFAEPFVLPAGTVLRAEFEWDNSADNPENPFSPPQRVVEGEQSSNEMAGLIIGGLPVRPEDEWKHWLGVGAHWLKMEAVKAAAKAKAAANAGPATSPPPR